jgi:hypothetical protein
LERGVVDDRIEFYRAALPDQVGAVQRLTDVRAVVFDGLVQTYPLVATIMQADREARGTVWPHGPLYYRRMHDALAPALAQQLGRAATQLASIWYTACVEGEPPNATPPAGSVRSFDTD